MYYTCIIILAIVVIAFILTFRRAIARALDYVFLPRKKRQFVDNNERVLGRRYSKKFWDMYN